LARDQQRRPAESQISGGVARQRSMLSSEGHKIEKSSGKKRPAVEHYEEAVVKF
jgi:hypothetical protein